MTQPDHPSVNPRIPALETDAFVEPDYANTPTEDLSYARAWARKVLRWRRDPEMHRMPPPYNPPSMRKRVGYTTKYPKPSELGIPARGNPALPLRLDLVPPANWKRLVPEIRAMVLEDERAIAARLPPDHPARAWVAPPRLPTGPPPKGRREVIWQGHGAPVPYHPRGEAPSPAT